MSDLQSISPKIVLASSALSIDDLLKKLSLLPSKNAIQLFDPDSICCIEHLTWSYINARTIFSNKQNRAKTISIEMLLCAALSSQIGEAIKKTGAKSNGEFILFSENVSDYNKISKYLSNVSEFDPSKEEAEARIKRLGIVSGEVEDLIQEIAFHATE